MRILYFVRLYSGIEGGLNRGVWSPCGVPTITRMIEALDKGPHELKVMFACKNYGTKWDVLRDVTLRPDGLSGEVEVLSGEDVFPAWLGCIRSRLSIVRQTWKLRTAIKKFKPDVVYIDRGNLWAATFMSRWYSVPVVWRVMGVLGPMRDALTNSGWRAALLRFAFRSPFAAVVCTLDGSGGGPWMKQALDHAVPMYLLLNGVDRDSVAAASMKLTSATQHRTKTIVLFVGRLEVNKGCEEFVEAMIELERLAPGQLEAVIVGDGSMFGTLKQKAEEASTKVTFTGSISHAEVIAWQKRADLYVSLNRMGNLSNANLEALAAGACMIIPESDAGSGIDIDTDEKIPANAAFRFGRVDEIDKLRDSIFMLHRNPEQRANMAREAQQVAAELIPSWHQRVLWEIEIFERIASRGANVEATQ